MEHISKASDTEITITTTTTQTNTVSVAQMQNRVKNLTGQIAVVQAQIDLINSRISQATALGVATEAISKEILQ